MSQDTMETLEKSKNVVKDLKLVSSKYTTNMMLWSPEGKLKCYANVGEILEEFYNVRIQFYHKRKRAMLKSLSQESQLSENKSRFINAIVSGSMIMTNRNKKDIIDQLTKEKYDKKSTGTNVEGNYDYLLNMPLHILTKEKVAELSEETVRLKKEYAYIEGTSVEEMYRKDLKAINIT
jgi:DNA topoisomerase-2